MTRWIYTNRHSSVLVSCFPGKISATSTTSQTNDQIPFLNWSHGGRSGVKIGETLEDSCFLEGRKEGDSGVKPWETTDNLTYISTTMAVFGQIRNQHRCHSLVFLEKKDYQYPILLILPLVPIIRSFFSFHFNQSDVQS